MYIVSEVNGHFPGVYAGGKSQLGDGVHISAMMLYLELWYHLRTAAPMLLATTHKEPPTVHHDGTS